MGLKLDKAREIAAKFPNTSKSSLAEMLSKDNPILFDNKEEARLYIRRATGSQGKKSRTNIKALVPQSLRPNGVVYNPYELPSEEHNNKTPYRINPTKDVIIGLISDVHLPYQCNEALTTALNHCKKEKITHLLLNGDIMDCYQISSFAKDPSQRSFKYEIDTVRAFLKTLTEKFKGVKIIFKEGNHEARYVRFMRTKAPELLGFEAFSLESLLGLKALGIEYVPDSKLIECGNLMIIHGHEFGQQIFSPVNPARGYFLKAKTNVIGGHNHQVSSHSENRLDGKQIVAYSTGHLADPHPEYRPINNWSHGFAIIKHVKTKDNKINFVINNYKIIDGQIY